MSILSENLKRLRKLNKKTQIEIAEAINKTQPAYAKYERGLTEPDIKTLNLLAKYYNIDITSLLEKQKNNLSDILIRLRETNKLTQEEVAKKLDLTASAYSKYERGIATPNPETIIKLSKIFNVSTDYLLGINTDTEEQKNKDLKTQPCSIIIQKESSKKEFYVSNEKAKLIEILIEQLKDF